MTDDCFSVWGPPAMKTTVIWLLCMTQGKEQVSCRHPKVDYECEFAKKTVYMIDYGAPVRFDIINGHHRRHRR